MPRAPPPQERIWTSPQDPKPLNPLQAQAAAAHFLEKYGAKSWMATSEHQENLYALPDVRQATSVGWELPDWRTKTMMPSALEHTGRGVWFRVFQLAEDEISRCALRDSCTTLQQISIDFELHRLSLHRVVFDGRNPKRILSLHYVAVKAPGEGEGFVAYPVMRELVKGGRERFSSFMPLRIRRFGFFGEWSLSLKYDLSGFRRPPYVSVADWQGLQPHTGIRTPAGHLLSENMKMRDTVLCGRSGKENDGGHCNLERWMDLRNLRTPVVKLAEDARKVAALERQNLEREFNRHMSRWERAGRERDIENRGPKPFYPWKAPQYDDASIVWEADTLDGEGMYDTFTLDAISQIVSGRFKSPSSTLKTEWSDNFSSVSKAWNPEGPLYILLHPWGFGWLPMDATFPAIVDAAEGRLTRPTWAKGPVEYSDSFIDSLFIPGTEQGFKDMMKLMLTIAANPAMMEHDFSES
ncbi:hypothetical protein P7C70_g1890, partial [Phenoliferia sp. Uapishka_3]